jgi:hypothetical protein
MSTSELQSRANLWIALAVGCIGCGGGTGTGDDANLTEGTVRFEISGAAVGALGGPEDAARASWQAACDAWLERTVKLAGSASIEAYECGEAKDIGGSDGYQFASTATATIAASLPTETFEPGQIAGSIGPRAVAYASWQAACDKSLERVKAIYGDRLLAGTCQLPADIGGSDGWMLSSALSLWIAPSKGEVVTAKGWVAGAIGQRGISFSTWREGCDAWLADLTARSTGQFLMQYSCGEAKDIGDSGGYLFASPTTASFAFPLAEGSAAETKDLGAVDGTAGSRAEAIASWQKACAAKLDQAKADAGDRYLASVCHEPKDVGSGTWQYSSSATAWLGDLAKLPEPEDPPPPPADDALKDGPPAANCKERCVAMMTACNAGPIESTCDGMCAPSPTEAQLSCAEATSCDHLEDWSGKCLLFQ